ncbi:MAG: 4Fe-4S dicluster domain-containing protein [Bacteroidales bacterium]|nr:4Fe-4S dicluster domain-containing protein [Bacteroidales bacterium]HPD95951.1 4Fe-4S dicluster domain-containing protein [Tenuifilaceae bacterium]HRX30925.1 4Fe-4S dicluster domain-containing protein [Tenuifilaceae bacterium]
MIDFGYTPMPITVHNMDKADLSLAKWLAERDETFNHCISCGSCAATCTAGKFTDFSFRELTHSIRRGEISKAFSESEKCMLCGKCILVCPRNVNTRNIVMLIRKANQIFKP